MHNTMLQEVFFGPPEVGLRLKLDSSAHFLLKYIEKREAHAVCLLFGAGGVFVCFKTFEF
jgi:hypothetical protein